MPIHKTEPPWEFLLSASRNSLQSYELSRLSHAANLRKEIGQLLDSWLEENAAAMLARWLMQQREHALSAPDSQSGADPRTVHPSNNAHSVSDNFLADQAVAPPVARGPS
jgi:hypothetical protein